MTYRSPDETCIHHSSDDTDSHSLLLLRLTACGPAPSQDEGVNGIGADSEDNHADVAAGEIHGPTSTKKANDSHSFRDSDMPSALVHSS